jgi:hypothetical protein
MEASGLLRGQLQSTLGGTFVEAYMSDTMKVGGGL